MTDHDPTSEGAVLRRVALPVPLHREFDYLARAEWTEDDHGRVVRVRLGRRRSLGVIVAQPTETAIPAVQLASIDRFVDELPRVPADVLSLARFASSYYQFPLGMTLAHALPPRGGREDITARTVPGGYRVTEAGKTELAALPARARTQVRLANLLLRKPAVGRDDLLASLPSSGPFLRRWLNAGWLETVFAPGPEGAPERSLPSLLPAQEAAFRAIDGSAGAYGPFLLHGITGSGKTEVYLSAAAEVIGRGGQVLMLVPEINLTPQLADRVRRALPRARVVMLHSHVASGQRLVTWREAAAGTAQFVLGTRLAVFAPLPKLQLVIVDEEHDASYKQQDGLRYHARDLAVYRAHERGIPVVLGSATPSLESLSQARRGRYRLLRLPDRAGGGELPVVRLAPQRGGSTTVGLTQPLIDALSANLQRREQSLLFINRRGFAPSMLCVACAWAAACHRCSARLVVHLAEKRLRCHHCAHEEPLPIACPLCGNQDLLPLGFGTQRMEAAIAELFPAARVARVDADSTRRREAWPRVLRAILAGDLDILVGTQMMVKGHDFPNLTLVGILGADNALYSADFRATERLFAQLTQVAGRAGRASRRGQVLIQTDFPEHPLFRALATGDDSALMSALFSERRQLGLPPFSRLALLRAESSDRQLTTRFVDAAHEYARSVVGGYRGVQLHPPVAARMARKAGFERAQILIQSNTAAQLQPFLVMLREWLTEQSARNVRWSLDVDPQDVD
jgi:primosomal protein N' (replication factor Y)